MNRTFIWCLLSEKRLLKKISYVVVLLMVPLFVLTMKRLSEEEAGILNIGLYSEDVEGSLSNQIIERLLTEESIFRFMQFDSEEQAVKALRERKVDAVWIFPEKLYEKIDELAKKQRVKPVVRVVEREDDVALVFSREILCSMVYPDFVYRTYVNYVYEHMGENSMTEEELRDVYKELEWKGSLFQSVGSDGEQIQDQKYFMAPLRGLLALWLVLAGFAALLYHKMDERNGVYDAVPLRKRLGFSFGLQGVVLINCGLIYLIACKILGIQQNLPYEILCLIVFLISISVFCNVIGLVIRRVEGIGVLIPFMVFLMAALCPIFIDLRIVGPIRNVFPPTFYLNAIRNVKYLWSLVIYDLVGLALCLGLNYISGKRRSR